jgi:hypothetical protein
MVSFKMSELRRFFCVVLVWYLSDSVLGCQNVRMRLRSLQLRYSILLSPLSSRTLESVRGTLASLPAAFR